MDLTVLALTAPALPVILTGVSLVPQAAGAALALGPSMELIPANVQTLDVRLVIAMGV